MMIASLLAVGCGSNENKVEQETSNLKPLMVLYGRYVGQHRGQPPPNEAAFKEFIKSADTSALPSGGGKNIDSLFISTRDQKPYQIIYGAANGPPGPGGQPVVAYEQEGVGGRRYVASVLGAIEEVDEARFRQSSRVPNKNLFFWRIVTSKATNSLALFVSSLFESVV
jgi:hypothetical protein